MKARIILTAMAAITLAACNSRPDQVQSSIPGTYVKSSKGEYGQADDTLIITHVTGTTYLIIQNTTYQAIRDGKLLPRHRKAQKLNGLYDPQKQILNETTGGLIYSFEPDKKLLHINQGVYRKL